MIVKTEAIVLRSRKFRETSSILALYSKEFGKISVIAKGARARGNKFGSSLQPLGHVAAVLYKHEGRDLHLLSQCDTISRFHHLAEDLDKFASAMSVVEMLEHVAHGEQRNDQLFNLTLAVLRAIENAPAGPGAIQLFFELHLSDLLGFKPNFHTCLSCGKPLDEKALGTKGGELRLMSGGVLCAQCSEGAGNQGRASLAAIRILQRIQETTDPEALTPLRMTGHQMEEVRAILRQYLQNHVGGLDRLKAQSVATSITENTQQHHSVL